MPKLPDSPSSKDFQTATNLNIFTMGMIKSMIPGLTYRQVGSWDNQGLVHHDRITDETGWRRFSMKDAVKLQIIFALRNFGLPALAVKNCLASIESTFEVFFYKTVKSNKVILLIRSGGHAQFLVSEPSMDEYFLSEYATTPALILPFYEYVKNLDGGYPDSQEVVTSLQCLIKDILSGDDWRMSSSVQRIMDADFVVRKPDGGYFIIETKLRKSKEGAMGGKLKAG